MRIVFLTLLSSRLERISRIVLGINGQHIFTVGYVIRDIKFKGDVAALVCADLLAVDVNGSLVVNGSEMKNCSEPRILLWNCKLP